MVDGGLCYCLFELILVYFGCLFGCLVGCFGGVGGGCVWLGWFGGFLVCFVLL